MALTDFVGNKKQTVTLMLPQLEKGQIVYVKEPVTVKDSDTTGITVVRKSAAGEKSLHYLPWAQLHGLKIED